MPSLLTQLNPLRLLGFHRAPDAAPTVAQVEANARHLVWDIAWFGIAWGLLINFLQVYVVRLGASSLLVGAITYGPALIGIFWQMPAAALMTRAGQRMKWVIVSGFFYRLTFLLVALVPFVFAAGRAEVTAAIWLLQAFPVTVSNMAFLSMLADAVPADRLTQVIGWRMAAFGLANTLSTLAAGRLLPLLPFPLNYQVLFLIGYAATMVSWWHIWQLHVPDREPDRQKRRPMLSEIGQTLRYPGFARFLLAVATLQLALGMIAPLLPLYWVRRLDATDGQISIVMTTFSGAMVVGSLLMRRVVRRVGRERALAAGALGYALYPLLTSLSPSVWWLVLWAMPAGLFNAAISVNLFDNLVSVTPNADRTTHIGVYNAGINVALFIGPVLAGLLANTPGGPALGLRVASAVVLLAGAMFVARAAGARRSPP